MKRIFILYGALVILVVGLIIWRVSSFEFNLPFTNQARATVNGNELKILVADDEEERKEGLSNRRSLNENTGMLFVFEEKGNHAFWMRNMNFPLDIIYLDGGKVVDIKKNVPPAEDSNQNPPIYTPKSPANSVLEVAAGVSDKMKLTEGSEIQFQNIE